MEDEPICALVNDAGPVSERKHASPREHVATCARSRAGADIAASGHPKLRIIQPGDSVLSRCRSCGRKRSGSSASSSMKSVVSQPVRAAKCHAYMCLAVARNLRSLDRRTQLPRDAPSEEAGRQVIGVEVLGELQPRWLPRQPESAEHR